MKQLAVVLLILIATQAYSLESNAAMYPLQMVIDTYHVSGASRAASRTKRVTAVFYPFDLPSCPTGWATAHDAALAFYTRFDKAYRGTGSRTELVGFLLESREGRFFYTNAVILPDAFKLSASISRPRDWQIRDMLHTHPRGRGFQEGFSTDDRDAVMKGTILGSYLRTPFGYVRYLNRQLAKASRMSWGAWGMSICIGRVFYNINDI